MGGVTRLRLCRLTNQDRIARNLYLDHAKRRRLPEDSLEPLGLPSSLGPPDQTASRSSGGLPVALRSSVGLPEEEVLRREQREGIIAAIGRLPMGLSAGAVKSCLHRARRHFAEVYLGRDD